MVKKILIIGIIILFLATIINPSDAIYINKKPINLINFGNSLYVGGSGPGNYSKIQDAIDDSVNGDTVFVYDDSSPYFENLDINKSIKLKGENKKTTEIISNGSLYTIKFVNNNSVITGFSIGGFKNHTIGIIIPESGCNINVYDNYFNQLISGIYTYSKNNNIINNQFFNIKNYCIRLCNKSSRNIVKQNQCVLVNSVTGICVFNSNHNKICNNTISSIRLDGIVLSAGSNNNTIKKNTIKFCKQIGIYLVNRCPFNLIKENQISSCKKGISIGTGNYNLIINNIIFDNNDYGLYINRNTNNNTVYHNNFVNNSINCFISGNGTWDNGYPSGGNYWGDYKGLDNFSGPNQDIPGSDGIGDLPYKIEPSYCDNWDKYPLIYLLEPKLNVIIKRGLHRSFCVDIENVGMVNAYDVKWSIIVFRRGLFKRNILNMSGNISILEKGILETVFDRPFGFGFIKATVNVSADGIDPIEITKKGFIFLRFIRLRRFL